MAAIANAPPASPIPVTTGAPPVDERELIVPVAPAVTLEVTLAGVNVQGFGAAEDGNIS